MRKALALVGLSAVFVLISMYTQNSNPTASQVSAVLSLLTLIVGSVYINRDERGGKIVPWAGLALPILLFLNYGNPLYLLAGLFLGIGFLWKSELSLISLVLAGFLLGWLALQEDAYLVRTIGTFILAASIITGVASLYFALKLR
ncbi:hypothetical protein [Thermococcus sp. GR6]|uniref:hypothetical protein n=1 Tax=Thermococcus sp. GR6 TaxID=1638256 RepID=UPI001432028A|nr:hypothetical protein [Thermococcus sp. GR6]NJE42332.1 hypothetical protein [Thermococcus sp. GR6]